MTSVAWLLKWLLKAAIFFTLFAFALNNQADVTVRFFFGQQWKAPLVLVVLSAFCLGLLMGILGMVPRWWRHRREALLAKRRAAAVAQASPANASAVTTDTPAPLPPHGI
jgi:lipopolysaccharide assembly protein A